LKQREGFVRYSGILMDYAFVLCRWIFFKSTYDVLDMVVVVVSWLLDIILMMERYGLAQEDGGATKKDKNKLQR
jgi:hypothetical protein